MIVKHHLSFRQLLAGIHNLVWYELHGSVESAFQLEKRLKDVEQKRKIHLIEKMNSDWKDFYHAII